VAEVTANLTVGQLVAERPSHARVFERYGINYRCGAKRALGEVCAAQGIDTQEVVAALRQADQQSAGMGETNWTDATLGELIANILNEHHACLRRELRRLSELTAEVHSVHGQRHSELAEVN
jgi:regulator of cell morphogenesis and NO signaling